MTGLGPAGSNDAEAPSGDDLNLPVEVLVGGKPAEVQFRGRASCCPGYDRIRFRIPEGVSGCCVPLTVRLDAVESNAATISVSENGAECGGQELTPELLEYYRREGAWKSASLNINRTVQLMPAPAPSTGLVAASASFFEYTVRGLHRYACMGQPPGVVTTSPATSSTKTIGACTTTRPESICRPDWRRRRRRRQ